MNVATLTSTQHRLSLAQRTYDRVFDAAYTVPQTEQVVSGTIVSAAGCGEDGISTLLCPRVVLRSYGFFIWLSIVGFDCVFYHRNQLLLT